jgi:hypothetical protein
MLISEPTKRIFNKDIAISLINKGFNVVDVEIHKKNPKWLIFHFADTLSLREEFTEITNQIKSSK